MMKKQTLQTIVRHLKGITAAIEKEVESPFLYKGKCISSLSDDDLMEAYESACNNGFLPDGLKRSAIAEIMAEGEKRGHLDLLNRERIIFCRKCKFKLTIPANWNKGTWDQKCMNCGKINRIVIE